MPLPERFNHFVQTNSSPPKDQKPMKCLSKKKPMQMVWERFWHPELKYHNPLTSSDSTLWGSGHPKPEWHNPSTFSDSTLSGPGHKDGLSSNPSSATGSRNALMPSPQVKFTLDNKHNSDASLNKDSSNCSKSQSDQTPSNPKEDPPDFELRGGAKYPEEKKVPPWMCIFWFAAGGWGKPTWGDVKAAGNKKEFKRPHVKKAKKEDAPPADPPADEPAAAGDDADTVVGTS